MPAGPKLQVSAKGRSEISVNCERKKRRRKGIRFYNLFFLNLTFAVGKAFRMASAVLIPTTPSPTIAMFFMFINNIIFI
jgi:hypothetical protein